jgi:hypothetical protein
MALFWVAGAFPKATGPKSYPKQALTWLELPYGLAYEYFYIFLFSQDKSSFYPREW